MSAEYSGGYHGAPTTWCGDGGDSTAVTAYLIGVYGAANDADILVNLYKVTGFFHNGVLRLFKKFGQESFILLGSTLADSYHNDRGNYICPDEGVKTKKVSGDGQQIESCNGKEACDHGIEPALGSRILPEESKQDRDSKGSCKSVDSQHNDILEECGRINRKDYYDESDNKGGDIGNLFKLIGRSLFLGSALIYILDKCAGAYHCQRGYGGHNCQKERTSVCQPDTCRSR